MYRAYTFQDKAAFDAALLNSTAATDGSLVTEVGQVDGGPEGFHVIAYWPFSEPASFAGALIEPAAAPVWFAGVARTSPAPAVPSEVTNFQARAAMRAVIMEDGRSLERTVNELLLQAKSAAAALPDSSPERINADQAWLAWEQSNIFVRTGTLVNSLGSLLGFSENQLDDLFRQASLVEA